MKAFSHPDFHRNQSHVGPHNPCVHCGKAVKNTTKARMVLVCCSEIDPQPPHPADCQGNQGGFYIGPECQKLLDKERRTS